MRVTQFKQLFIGHTSRIYTWTRSRSFVVFIYSYYIVSYCFSMKQIHTCFKTAFFYSVNIPSTVIGIDNIEMIGIDFSP